MDIKSESPQSRKRALRAQLVKIDPGLSDHQLHSLKLACRLLDIPQETAYSFIDLYELIEHKMPHCAPSLVYQMLLRVGFPKCNLQELHRFVTFEIHLEENIMLDLVLTLAFLLGEMNSECYEQVKEIARKTFLPEYHQTRILSPSHLLELLLDKGVISLENLNYLFAWFEAVGCVEYHDHLRQFCVRHGIQEPDWSNLRIPIDPSHQEVTSDRSRYEDNAITLFQHYHNALCQSLHDPISVARMLHGEKILSEATLTIVESTRQTLSQRRTTLLDAALDAIRNSYHNLEVFASVLLKFTDNVPLANAILSDFKKEFHQNDHQEESYYVEGSVLIPQAMGKTFNEIRKKFGSTYFKVRRAISNNPPPVEEIKMLLQVSFIDLKPQIVHVNTIDEVLDIVRDKCTLTDINYLEIIVEEFDIKEAKVHIQAYKMSIEEFCKTVSVRLCLDQNFRMSNTSLSLKCETVTFILDWNPDDYILDDIREVLSETFERLSIYVQINVITKTNSIAVTCTFPLSLFPSLIAKAQETIELVKKKGLLKLRIGHCIIFDKRKTDEEKKVLEMAMTIDLKALIQRKNMEIEYLKYQLTQCKEKPYVTLLTESQPRPDNLLQSEVMSRTLLFPEKRFSRAESGYSSQLSLSSGSTSSDYLIDSNGGVTSEEKSTEKRVGAGTHIMWHRDCVTLTSPTMEECEEVIMNLKILGEHWKIILDKSSPDCLQIMLTNINQCLVRTLEICNTAFNSHCVNELSHVLAQNETLKKVWLKSSPLPPDSLTIISAALSVNNTLQTLSIWNDNNITDRDISHLSRMLTVNTTLEELCVCDSPNITKFGEQQIFEVLKDNNISITILINGNCLRHKQ